MELQGSGKTTLGNIMLKIFGNHGIEVVNPRHFTGNFNAHIQYKTIIVLNEAIWGGDKLAEAVMKAATTENRMVLERKGIDAKEGTNYWNMFVISNNNFCVPVTMDNRRFFILEVSDSCVQDHKYFQELYYAIENNDEVEEFFWFLKQRALPIGWRAASALPRTRASVMMMLRNRQHTLLRWMLNKCAEGKWTFLAYGVLGLQEHDIINPTEATPFVDKDSVMAAFNKEMEQDKMLKVHSQINNKTSFTQ